MLDSAHWNGGLSTAARLREQGGEPFELDRFLEAAHQLGVTISVTPGGTSFLAVVIAAGGVRSITLNACLTGSWLQVMVLAEAFGHLVIRKTPVRMCRLDNRDRGAQAIGAMLVVPVEAVERIARGSTTATCVAAQYGVPQSLIELRVHLAGRIGEVLARQGNPNWSLAAIRRAVRRRLDDRAQIYEPHSL